MILGEGIECLQFQKVAAGRALGEEEAQGVCVANYRLLSYRESLDNPLADLICPQASWLTSDGCYRWQRESVDIVH